jgi:methyl-accepting chemotaxis protein
MFQKKIGHVLQNIKLQHQLLLLLLLSSIVPVSAVGTYGILSSTTALSDLAKTKLEEHATDQAQQIEVILERIGSDVLFLSKTPELQNIISTPTESSSASIQQLQDTFVALMQTRAYYMQVRYLDETGQEIIRVDSDGETVKVIPDSALQNKGDRPYFTEAMALAPGDLYTSPVELNQEQGKIETPFKPTIRYATPIVDSSGRKKGIVIINVLANEFLQVIKNANEGGGTEAILADQNGYYISHPNAEKEWGVDLKKDEKLENDLPEEIVQQILSSEQGLIDQGTDQLIAYDRFVISPNPSRSLIVINQVPKSVIFASVNQLKIIFGLITLASLASALTLGIFRGRQLVSLLEQLASGISTTSRQIFSALAEQERIASQQAASVNETTTTMDELEASSQQSAEQAKAAVDAAQGALQLAEGGTQAVKKTLEGMFTLEEKVEAIAEQIVRLSEQANEVGSISQLVSDLSNRTHMLALNSSVEAIRAGEHGKGFAVVADEIRKLADQSQRSTERISGLVSEIQRAINSTVMVAEEGTKTVKVGVHIAQETDQAFAGVADAVSKVVLNNQQISLNLKQQVDAMQQVVEAMDTINKGSKETATGISQIKSGTEDLNNSAQVLKQMV